jgi:DNA-binding CsgD family transcriptional regulator
VDELYAAPRPGGFRLDTIVRLRALVPSDMTAWVETRVGQPEVDAIASPHDLLSDGPRRFARVRDEHPVLAHFERSRHGGAAKLSDYVSPTQFRRLRLYQDFFRPAGIEHQISIALPSAGRRLVRITLNRAHGDFGERDRRVLDLVRPHVARAQENAELLERLGAEHRGLEHTADATDLGIVLVRRGGAYVSPRAREQLSAYFPASSMRHGALPAHIVEWLGSGQPAREPLLVEHDGGRLEIRLLPHADGRLLVVRERATRVLPRALESLGLTPRQAEVLAWLAQGKTNADIAAILAISPSTVARHVEAIFATLGVRTRTAAAAAAFASGPDAGDRDARTFTRR